MPEFVAAQLDALAPVGTKPRSHKRPRIDLRLWLDHEHWIAWTMCGELVSVEELESGSMRGSPEVRRLRPDEFSAVFAVNRLIPTVIALYRGDSLDRGPVWRYIAHYDLRGALDAALARAREKEGRRAVAAAPAVATPAEPETPRATKTRHHPFGNFIVYRRPRDGDGLPSFAAVLELPPVPAAFPSRRAAQRFLAKMPRLGLDANGLAFARVVGSVEVRPRWRPGIPVPRNPEDAIELIRKEPRVVLPELDVAWMPRYAQAADGRWVLKQVQKRGTVRGSTRRILLDKVAAEGRRVATALEDDAVRRSARAWTTEIDDQLQTAMRVAHKAERRLPEAWLDQLGMERVSLGPDWQPVANVGRVTDEAHWLRAPCEYGQPHVDGQRRRIVELRIDDLAELLEIAGMRPRFLLLKETTDLPPEWRLIR